MKLCLFLSLVILMGGCVSKPIDFKKEQGWTISQIEMQSEIEDLHKMIIFQCYRQNVLEGVIMRPTKTRDIDTSGYYWEHAYYDSFGVYEQKYYDLGTMIKNQLGKP